MIFEEEGKGCEITSERLNKSKADGKARNTDVFSTVFQMEPERVAVPHPETRTLRLTFVSCWDM